jgi:preprotein translocase subunit SecF
LCFLLFIYIFGLNFNICFRQNIEVDLGRVIAKISSQINPTTSAKVTEKKKERKKEKKTSHNEPAEQKDKATQDIPVEAPSVEKPKDKKKQKKLKKAHSTSTTTVPEVSMLNEQPGNPQGTNNDEPQGPSQ